jgi:hypothetical protein
MGFAAREELAPPALELGFGLEGLEASPGRLPDASPDDQDGGLAEERATLAEMIAARTTTRRVDLTKFQAAHPLLPMH